MWPFRNNQKNVAFMGQLDSIMADMRRDVCMACSERCGDPHDDAGEVGPAICGLCRVCLETGIHPKVPQPMCKELLERYG